MNELKDNVLDQVNGGGLISDIVDIIIDEISESNSESEPTEPSSYGCVGEAS